MNILIFYENKEYFYDEKNNQSYLTLQAGCIEYSKNIANAIKNLGTKKVSELYKPTQLVKFVAYKMNGTKITEVLNGDSVSFYLNEASTGYKISVLANKSNVSIHDIINNTKFEVKENLYLYPSNKGYIYINLFVTEIKPMELPN